MKLDLVSSKYFYFKSLKKCLGIAEAGRRRGGVLGGFIPPPVTVLSKL